MSDDLTASGAPLSIKLSLTLWTPHGFKDHQLHATGREVSAKKAERRLKRGMERQD